MSAGSLIERARALLAAGQPSYSDLMACAEYAGKLMYYVEALADELEDTTDPAGRLGRLTARADEAEARLAEEKEELERKKAQVTGSSNVADRPQPSNCPPA